MKSHFILIGLLACVMLTGCSLKEREKNIREREKEISARSQQLLLLEQSLQLREADLQKREKALDSSKREIEAPAIYNEAYTGKWNVKMKCIETGCEGSAIGDTKTEQWELGYNDNDSSMVAKAYTRDKLVRIYNGSSRSSGLYLFDGKLMRVVLRLNNDKKMEGTREVFRENCKIVYSVVAEKL